jgi:phosphatidate cytidylyltransferase
MGDLGLRVAAAAVLGAIALFAAYRGGALAALLALAASLAVAVEWLLVTGHRAFSTAAIIAVLLAVISVGVAAFGWLGWAVMLAVLGGAMLGAMERDSWLGAAVPYAAAIGIGLLALRNDPVLGWPALMFLFATVWATDTAAYFAGRIIGGPKLWPAVSPKKTWSGAFGGLAGGIVAAMLVMMAAGISVTPMLVVVAALLSVVSQAGDLLESAVKRQFGVKDASQIIPGHGGVMDRVDGLLTAAAAAALIGWLHGGADAIGQGLLQW